MIKRMVQKFEDKGLIFQLGLFLAAAAAFTLPFMVRSHSVLKVIGVLVRYNNSRFLPVLAILLFLTLIIKNSRLSALLTALVVFPVCAFALVGIWASMYTETNIIAGILPRMDALSYFTSAMALLEKGFLVGYTRRRPFFAGLFGAILWIVNRDLPTAIAVVAFLSALALFFTLLEVRRVLNPLAAVVFFIPQFLYYRMYIGNIMSETLGFYLGLVSFLLFLRALTGTDARPKRSLLLFSAAAFVFTLSQLARPGAILTIPFLIIFAGWYFSKKGKMTYQALGLVLASVLAAYFLNHLMFSQLTAGDSHQYNNAGYGLYGVVAGGKSWAQIRSDHPEIASLPPGQREQAITQAILREFLDHPGNFFKGMAVQFYYIFSLFPVHKTNVYAYMLSSNNGVDGFLIGFYYLLSVLGALNLIIKRKEILSIFTGILIIGFFISLPVSPAYQSQFMRYYPATIPLLGFLPALGLAWVSSKAARKFPKTRWINPGASETTLHVFNAAIALSILLMVLGPYLAASRSRDEAQPEMSCLPDETPVLLPYYAGSDVKVRVITKTWLPAISEEDFRLGALNIPDVKTKDYFRRLSAPVNIFPSINLLTDDVLYVLVGPEQSPSSTGVYSACGFIEDVYGSPADSGYFYPRVIQAE